MEAIVSGCAGFVGAKVTEMMLDAGHTVVGVDDVNDAYDVALKMWRLERLRGRAGFQHVRMSVNDREALARLVADRKPDAFLNLAARAGVRQSLLDPFAYLETNGGGMLSVLEACRRADVRKVLLSSTSSLYGQHNPTPYHEDADTSRPLSPYAASKKAAEAMLASYAHLYGIDAPVLRYFTVYGPAGRPDMSPLRFVRWIVEGEPLVLHGDGTQRRDFTYVDDIARGTIAALDLRGHHVINLGNDRPVTMNRLVEIIEAAAGRRARVVRKPRHEADMDATWADISRAREMLGWSPTVSIVEGVERTVRWYLENRDWASKLDLGSA